MSTPVVMPQMGESIAEGTIVRWIKKVGDSVDRDEPLFEISTDKVDAEIPSPAAGVLMAIAVKEGETVPVNSVVATIGAAGEVPEVPRCLKCLRCLRSSANGAKTSAQADGTSAPTVAAPAPPSTTNAALAAPQRLKETIATSLPARPQDREGTQRRHRPDPGIGHRRPCHQAGHPRLHREARGRRSLDSRSARPASEPLAPDRPFTIGAAGARDRPDVGDAQEDRRAHGAQQAHLGACVLGLRSELFEGRSDSQGEEGRLRAVAVRS